MPSSLSHINIITHTGIYNISKIELTSFLEIQQGYQIQIALFSMGNSKALSLQQYKIPKG